MPCGYMHILSALQLRKNYSKLAVGADVAPYLSINAPKSCELGTAYFSSCEVGLEDEDLEKGERHRFVLGSDTRADSLLRCEAVLDDGRQGAAPEVP